MGSNIKKKITSFFGGETKIQLNINIAATFFHWKISSIFEYLFLFSVKLTGNMLHLTFEKAILTTRYQYREHIY